MTERRHSEKEQLVRMARNFFARFFENDLLSPQGDFHATLSQALGLLATPGLFVPMLLLPLLMMDPEAARSWEIKLVFVFFSMLVMGVGQLLGCLHALHALNGVPGARDAS